MSDFSENAECTNCDGRKCMDCVLRYQHDYCVNDCPDCCGVVLAKPKPRTLSANERNQRTLDARQKDQARRAWLRSQAIAQKGTDR